MPRCFCVLVSLFAMPALAEPMTFVFSWEGQGGYGLRGAMVVDPSAIEGPFVRETDLTCFEIQGHRSEVPVGRWALQMLLPDTTWRLHFDPQALSFPVDGDDYAIPMPQAWNMNGAGDNCGRPGFGFNAGNVAQDLCIDGDLIEESQMPSVTPFPAVPGTFDFSADACRVPPLLS